VRWRWLSRMAAGIFPWTPRAERRARVEAARKEAGVSRRKAEEAQQVRRDLEAILQRNHFAQAIVEGLMSRRDDKQ
jgi:hypothetical protein